MATKGDDRLKEQLAKWKAKAGPAAVAPAPAGKKTEPAPPPARGRAAAGQPPPPPTPPPRRLTDRELFEQAVADVGDGSVAILKKYGHGHLSGEGEPEDSTNGEEGRSGDGSAEADGPPKPVGGAHLGEAALFLDAVEGARPLAKKPSEARKPKPKR